MSSPAAISSSSSHRKIWRSTSGTCIFFISTRHRLEIHLWLSHRITFQQKKRSTYNWKSFISKNWYQNFSCRQRKVEVRPFKPRYKYVMIGIEHGLVLNDTTLETKKILMQQYVAQIMKPENSGNQYITGLCQYFLRLCQHWNSRKCVTL